MRGGVYLTPHQHLVHVPPVRQLDRARLPAAELEAVAFIEATGRHVLGRDAEVELFEPPRRVGYDRAHQRIRRA